MTFTATLIELSIFLAAIAFFILVIYLIPAVIQLRGTAKAVEDFSQKGKEALENISLLVKRIDSQAEDAGDVIKRITQVGRKIVRLADIIVTQLNGPVITLASIIAGIEFGLRHFRKKEDDKNVRK